MNLTHDARRNTSRSRERGGASLNFLIFLVIAGAVAYVGYQYVPIAYRASLLKVYMQDTVDKAAATSQEPEWIERQLRSNAEDYNMPQDASINVQKEDGKYQARVRWTHTIPLPGYIYQYSFDHTVKSKGVMASH